MLTVSLLTEWFFVMSENDGIVLIPARYSSTRFPGKPLAQISGVSMIEHVYNNCCKSGLLSVVVTDDKRIEEHVNAFGGKVCRVDDDLASGTERIYQAYKRFYQREEISFVINVQGDEPLLGGSEIKKLISFHRLHNFDIATIVKKRTDQHGIENPNIVKTIFTERSGQCHYFSRAPIPFLRGKDVARDWHQHVGVYSYRAEALEKFCQHPLGKFEKVEALEQLRALEFGMTIGAVETDLNLIGVDTPEDIKKVEGALSGKRS